MKANLVSLALLCGCGSGYVTNQSSQDVLPLTSISLGYAFYHAYGDSITYGATLKSASTQNYSALVATAAAIPNRDYAIPGDLACDVPARQIFAAMDAPRQNAHGLYTILIGTNDADIKGVGGYEATFNLCHQASISWLAVAAENKLLGTDPVVTTVGPTSLESAYNWNALTTNAENASITFPFSLSSPGTVYAWYRIVDDAQGSFDYYLDGSLNGSGRSSTNPSMATPNGTSSSLALLRLTSIPAGLHTLTFKQTNVGASGVGIVAIGFPGSVNGPEVPKLLVGTVPKQRAGSFCSPNDAACQTYTADISANVALLKADGLNITLFDSRKYMSGTVHDMADGLHPNALGQLEIAHSVVDTLTAQLP